MPDIALINPPIGQDAGNHPLPYGLWQLASFLRSEGFCPTVLDLNFIWRKQRANYAALRALVLDVDSPVIGFTCMGNNFPTALELATDLKAARPDVIIVFGGPHASLIGEELLEAYSCIDYVVIGEGERTLTAMLTAKHVGDWPDIPGVLARDRPFTPRPLLPSLDILPPLDLQLLDWNAYLEPGIRDHFAFPLLAGSGCPFTCSFCSTSVMWERRFRVKSPARLVQEMSRLAAETGCRRFDLVHDIFTANKRYINDFCTELNNNKNIKDLRWLCSSRIDSLDTKEIEIMSTAGCAGIFFGVESASPSIQRSIGKRLKVERILPTFEECMKNKIDCVCSTVFGFPQETWQDISATAQLCIAARSAGVGRANMHLLMALPGTEIYRTAPLADQVEARDLRRAGLPIHTDRSFAWIMQHPQLFSAFHWVQHASISKDAMFAVMEWGTHLAVHSESLDHILRCFNGRLEDAIQIFLKYRNTRTDHESSLENAVHKSTLIGLQSIFAEEERRALILQVYRRQCLSQEQRFPYWIYKRDQVAGHLLYEVSADAVTINIYELDEQEARCWIPRQDLPEITTPELRKLGPCRPVQQHHAQRRRHEVH